MYRYNISLTSKPPLNKPSSKNDNNINREDSTSNRNLIMERKMRALQFVRKMNGHKESNGNSNKAGFLEGNGNFIVLAEPPPPPPPIPPHEQSPTPPPPPPPTPPSQPLKVEPQQQQIVDMEMETTPIRPQIQQKQLPKSVTFATDIEIKKEIDEGQQSQANNSQFKSPPTSAKPALKKNSSDVGQSGTENLQQQKSQPIAPKSALKKKSTGKKEAPLPRTFFTFIAKGLESEAIKMAMEKEAQSPEERMASIVGEKAESAERERRLEIQRRMKREDVLLREKARKLRMAMTTQASANAGYGSCSGSSVDSGRPRSAASIDSYDHQHQQQHPGPTSMIQNAACGQEHWQQHDASNVNGYDYHPQQNLQNGSEWEHRPQPQQKMVTVAWSLKPVDGIVAPFSWRPTVEQWRLELEIAARHAELVRTDFDAINKVVDAALHIHTNKITPPAPKMLNIGPVVPAEELTPQQQKRATRKLFLADGFGGTSKVGKEQQQKPEEEEGNGTLVQGSSIEMHEKNNDAEKEKEEHQKEKEKQAEAEENCNVNSSSNQMHNEPHEAVVMVELVGKQQEQQQLEEKANMEEMEEGEIEDDHDEVEEWPGAAADAVEEYAGQEFEQWQPAEDGEQLENEDGGQQHFDDQFGQKQMDEGDANGNENDDVLQVPYSSSPQLHQELEKEEAICEAHNFTGLSLDHRDGPMEGNLEEGEIIEFDETQQRQLAKIEEQRQIAKIEAKLFELQQRGRGKGQNKENKDNIHTGDSGDSNHHQLQQQENQQQKEAQQEDSSASMRLLKRPSILVEEEEEQQQNEQTSSSFGSFQDCGAGSRQQSISIDIDNSPEYIVLDDTMEMDSQLTPPLPSSRRRTLDGSAGKRGPASKRKKSAGTVDEIRRRSEPVQVKVRVETIGDEEVLCIDDDD